MSRRIPVVVVAGFLGAGKTTLLNHLLYAAGEARVAVVVNDFGSVNIDAMLVSAQVDSMVALGNGCLCCELDTADLDGMFARLARTGPDLIVVEASGVAEPAELVRMVTASGESRVRYAGLVMVVDSDAFAATRDRHPELDRHLALADLVVANKDDLVDPDQRASLHALLGQLAPGTPLLATNRGRIDVGLLLDAPRHRGRREPRARQLSFDDLLRAAPDGGAGGHGTHLHAAYQSVQLSTEHPLDPRAFAMFVGERVDGLYRMKGVCRFEEPGPPRHYELHLVGRHLAYTRTTRAGRPDTVPAGNDATVLVAIGTRLDEQELRRRFAACVRPPGSKPVPEPDLAMAAVHRYLEDHDDDPPVHAFGGHGVVEGVPAVDDVPADRWTS